MARPAPAARLDGPRGAGTLAAPRLSPERASVGIHSDVDGTPCDDGIVPFALMALLLMATPRIHPTQRQALWVVLAVLLVSERPASRAGEPRAVYGRA